MPYKPAQTKTKKFNKGKKQYVSKRKAGKRASKMSVRKINGVSGGITESLTVSGSFKKLRKGLVALGAPMNYVVTNSGNLDSDFLGVAPAAGLQTSTTMGQWNSAADIINYSHNVPVIATVSGQSPTRFHLHSLKANITMSNNTSNTMFVDLYDFCAKKDIPLSAATGATLNVTTPANAWLTSMLQQSDFSGGVAAYQVLGSSPTDGQIVKDYFKLVGKRSIVLPQNAVHVHKISLKLDKNFDLGEMAIQAAYLAGFAGITYYTMAVIRGMPCCNSGVSGGVITTIPSLMWTTQEHYEYAWVQSAGSVWYGQNNIIGAGTPSVLLLNNPVMGVPVGPCGPTGTSEPPPGDTGSSGPTGTEDPFV